MQTNRRQFLKNIGLISTGSVLGYFTFANQKIDLAAANQSYADGILNFINAYEAAGIEIHSLKILQQGKVLTEAYWQPFGPNHLHTLYSLSKSFTSTAIGMLVDDGKLSVDDLVIDYFKNDIPKAPNEFLKQMKVKHLLTMTTGHTIDTIPAIRQRNTENWAKIFFEQPVTKQPGTHFLYNTGATYILAEIVKLVSGMNLEDFLKPRLFTPLGINQYDWEKSSTGVNTGGFGLRIKTNDIANFGQLLLQKGQWKGQQLVSEKWVTEATSKQTESQLGGVDWSQGYGYQFWRCAPGFYRGDGAYGQFCLVIPQYDAVVVLTGESHNLQQSLDIIYKHILPLLKLGTFDETEQLNQRIKTLKIPINKGSLSENSNKIYNNKTYKLTTNEYNINSLGFGLFDDGGVLRINKNGKTQKIAFGWETWKLNKNKIQNPCPIPFRTHMPSQIAATGTWKNKNTLIINLKFVDAVHGDQYTISFNDNKIDVAMIWSVAKDSKSVVETRKNLVGNLT